MAYNLLVRKLGMGKERYLTSVEIKSYCKILGIKYYDAIIYLTRHKHLLTILKGIFYRPTIEERKLGINRVNHIEALAEALRMKGVRNWYLGLESALKLNNATHEFFAVDVIINDKIFRKNPINVLGNKVRFIKTKKELFNNGIIKKRKVRYSDIEKTVLDMIYLSRYNGKNDKETLNPIIPFIEKCSKDKLKKYAKNYNRAIEQRITSL